LVQKNRQADHLVFPMDQEKNNVTKSSLAGTLKPSTGGMEEEIDAILRQSGMRSEKDIIEAENLAFNAINPEEVKF
jgi:U3 small nucleolar RNA-associated protein 14